MGADGWVPLAPGSVGRAAETPAPGPGMAWFELARTPAPPIVVELPDDFVDDDPQSPRVRLPEGPSRTLDRARVRTHSSVSPITGMPKVTRVWDDALGVVGPDDLAERLGVGRQDERPAEKQAPAAAPRPARQAPRPKPQPKPHPKKPACAPATDEAVRDEGRVTLTWTADGKRVGFSGRREDLDVLARALSCACRPQPGDDVEPAPAAPAAAAKSWYDLAREALMQNAKDDREPEGARHEERQVKG